MKNLYVLIAFFFIGNVFSQNLQNANWVFEKNNLLQFLPLANPPTHTSIPSTLNYYGYEGSASLSDADGNLVLFSDGAKLWHVSGGIYTELTDGLLGSWSSAQNVIFVPRPNHPSRYYVVTISGTTSGTLGLYYSEVDINGTPVVIQLNIPLLDQFGDAITIANHITYSEALTSTIHADGENYWVVAPIQYSSDTEVSVLSYRVTEDGFVNESNVPNAPSQVTTYDQMDVTATPLQVKISRNTKEIAIANFFANIVLGKFDNATGIVTLTDEVFIDSFNYEACYGIEFSPNSQLFYYERVDYFSTTTLERVPVDDASDITVIETLTNSENCFLGGLQLALDDKIYATRDVAAYLYIVGDPDNTINPGLQSTSLDRNAQTGAFPQWVWQQGQCFETLNDAAHILSGQSSHEQRIDWIKSKAVIESGGESLLHAGNYVELNPGFEAVSGSNFKAYIEGCSDDFNYRMLPGGTKTDTHSKMANKSAFVKKNAQITVLPNPSDGMITVSANGTAFRNVMIVSTDGKIMLNQNNGGDIRQIDVSGFANGMYIIILQTQDEKTLRTKFLKN